jgi:hypothetical protein
MIIVSYIFCGFCVEMSAGHPVLINILLEEVTVFQIVTGLLTSQCTSTRIREGGL